MYVVQITDVDRFAQKVQETRQTVEVQVTPSVYPKEREGELFMETCVVISCIVDWKNADGLDNRWVWRETMELNSDRIGRVGESRLVKAFEALRQPFVVKFGHNRS